MRQSNDCNWCQSVRTRDGRSLSGLSVDQCHTCQLADRFHRWARFPARNSDSLGGASVLRLGPPACVSSSLLPAPYGTATGRCPAHCIPSLVRLAPLSSQASPTISSPATGGSTYTDTPGERPKWGARAMAEMRARLVTAHDDQVLASVAKLMAFTGGSRSNVRTWLRSPTAPVKLSYPLLSHRRRRNFIARAWRPGRTVDPC